VRNGIPKSKVLSIPVGRDTLTQTKSYISEMKKRNLSTVIITTDAYHCNRAITMAEDFDAIASCSPSQGGPNTLEKSRYRYLIREAGAYLAYITLGRRGIHISDHLTNGSLVRYVHELVR
jgi:vancomycin permeability regulator SanA